jgi:orotidine-5'-phosphate decarboxylase
LIVWASVTDYEMGRKIAANLTIWLMPGVGAKSGAKSGAARELLPKNL